MDTQPNCILKNKSHFIFDLTLNAFPHEIAPPQPLLKCQFLEVEVFWLLNAISLGERLSQGIWEDAVAKILA